MFCFFAPHLACAVFKLHRASRKIPVVHSERETPLPIPNRAVKPFSADGTWGATPWESRSPPVLLAARALMGAGCGLLWSAARSARRRLVWLGHTAPTARDAMLAPRNARFRVHSVAGCPDMRPAR